jgi:tetratricopeptide (TPR) repeat protein
LRGIADLAMPNELQRRIRDPRVQMDRRALEDLADHPPVLLLPPPTVLLLVRLLYVAGAVDKSELLLFGLQQRRPDDFVVNYRLARMIAFSGRGRVERVEQAIGFMRAAVALRPDNGTLHLNLGVLLRSARRSEQAIVAFRRGHELQPSRESELQLRKGLNEQGLACRKSGQWEKAIASFEEASRLTPKTPEQAGSHRELAWLLSTCPDPKLRNPALALQSAGIAVQSAKPDGASWSALGVARYRAGDWDGAIAALERACELRSGGGAAEHFFLAMAHLKRDGKGPARPFFDRAVRWMKEQAKAINANPVQKEELGRFRAEAAELLGIPQG